MQRLFAFLILILLITRTNGQEIKVMVKRGIISINNKIIKPSNGIVALTPPSSVQVNPNALVFIKKNNSICELKSGQTYSYEMMKKLFGTGKGFTKSYLSVLSNQDYSIKAQYGKTSRGKEDDPLWYSPMDTATILSDSVTLAAGSRNAPLLTDIKLYQVGQSDTIYLSKNDQKHRIKSPSSGTYIWTYKLEYINEITFTNSFIIPTQELKENLILSYKDYQKTISSFSPEMQRYLMDEYCYTNRIYFSE